MNWSERRRCSRSANNTTLSHGPQAGKEARAG